MASCTFHGSTLFAAVIICLATLPVALSNDQELLAIIAKTGPQGAGSSAARAARDELAQRSIDVLPALLTAMDTPNPVAANWYRSVFEEITARDLMQSHTEWPLEFLKQYVSDSTRRGRPRRLALELLDRLEPDFRTGWLPERLNDTEFRYEAVALAIGAGDRALQDKDMETARAQFRKAFENARDSSQVTGAADRLRAAGEPADVAKQLGLVTDWWLVGPFDAPDKSGFGLGFAPEREVDLKAMYEGQHNSKIGWIRHQTSDPLGQVNLVTVLGKTDEAVAYAWTEITVTMEQTVQLRCSADDSCLVWLNDKPVSTHEQWLNGTRFDRFVDPVTLVPGRNRILVKVCQGPQHRDPEVVNNWSLQLRLCDEDGQGIPFESALPAQAAAQK